MNDNKKASIIAVIVVVIGMILGFVSCSDSGTSSSSYQLHNKDGSINWEYYNDMQDYFNKHPEKRP